jgi:tRNA-dihydrouridine synthase B
MSLGGLFKGGRVLLAPLSGISDSPFRVICRRFGADGVYTEMISAEGLARGNAKTVGLTGFREEERPIGVQIFGTAPQRMAEAAGILEDLRPDFIDINACCPARRIVSRGGGAGLLRTPALLGEIVGAVAGATQLPVSVKIRIGWDDESINGAEIAGIAEEAGAAAVAVHGRTARQGFHGRSDWERVAEVKRAVSIPVVLTGDIMGPEDVTAGIAATGCDAVMVARGSLGRPWIFEQIRQYRAGGAYTDLAREKVANIVLGHLDLMIESYGEKMGVLRFRKHLLWYTKGMYGVVAWREQMSHLHIREEVAALLDHVLSRAGGGRKEIGEEGS